MYRVVCMDFSSKKKKLKTFYSDVLAKDLSKSRGVMRIKKKINKPVKCGQRSEHSVYWMLFTVNQRVYIRYSRKYYIPRKTLYYRVTQYKLYRILFSEF